MTKGIALLRAWYAQERGNQAQLAKFIGVDRASVHSWKDVPPEHCLQIEEFTGISRYKLRPDVYGRDPNKKRR